MEERLENIDKQLRFLSGMLLAWDSDRVDFDESSLEGVWYIVECIRKELRSET